MVNIMLRYLGIKTKLLDPIKIAINSVTPPNGRVIDLFAGSSTVAQFLMDDYVVFANDYQAYSYIAAKALVEHHTANTISSLDPQIVFGEHYKENKSELLKRFATPLTKEKELLDNIEDTYFGEIFDKFTDYFNHSAYAGHTENAHSFFFWLQ